MAKRQTKRRETFGQVDKLPSGRIRARYTGPDGVRHSAPATFGTLTDARAWLAKQQTAIAAGTWQTPSVAAAVAAERNQTLAKYADAWLTTRTNSRGDTLRPRTVDEYKRLLRAPDPDIADDKGGPLADLVALPLGTITPKRVREWRADQLATGRKTQTSRAYGLLSAIMRTAVEDRIIDANPCSVKGGQSTSTGRAVLPPTDAELEAIVTAIPERFRALVVIAAAGGLRYGEATELRGRDITIEHDDAGRVSAVRVTVDRAVTRTRAGFVVGAPKSDAGHRAVAIFGVDAAIIADHVRDHARFPDQLLFPAEDDPTRHLPQSTFHRSWDAARHAAGRPDMPFHALRHYAGTRYAQAGATPRETMARLGHSSSAAAMRYQHAGNRDDELAARMARRTS